MSNVKPQVGQVWLSAEYNEEMTINAIESGFVWFDGMSQEEMSINEYFTFIPQNDLEWLTVNVDKWFHDDCGFIRLSNDKVEFYTDDIDNEYCSQFQYYTLRQWQNMRYKLGLDKKPHIKANELATKLRRWSHRGLNIKDMKGGYDE